MGEGGERLAVLGGTFDPIHVGHLVAAVNVRHALALDRVLLVVANMPWQKAGRADLTPARDRLAMVEAAVEGVAGVEASAVEIDRGGDSYTADTLEALRDERPGRELFLVVGDDVAAELHTWRRPDTVRELATLVVVSRPGASPARLDGGWRHQRVEIPHLDLSSTDLRARAAKGRPLDFLVPAAVIRCIHERGLYRSS